MYLHGLLFTLRPYITPHEFVRSNGRPIHEDIIVTNAIATQSCAISHATERCLNAFPSRFDAPDTVSRYWIDD